MAHMEKKTIQVQISGIDYALKTDEDPGEVAKVIRFVDEKIKSLSDSTKVKSDTKIAVLAALNIASELFHMQKKYQEALTKLEKFETESKELCNTIDSQLSRFLEY
jgi:cell division protein ZapA (FtsZ GTPase activity inhibitor)